MTDRTPTIEVPTAVTAADVSSVNRDRINVAGDTVTAATEHLPEDQQKLVRWLYAYAKEQNWGWKDLAAQTRIDTSTLFRVFNDKYRDSKTGERIGLENLCERIARYKDLADRREHLKRLRFVETSVWRKTTKICGLALESSTCAFIWGESQIGKTACLQEHRRRNNHGQTVYVRVPASAGVQWLMKEIAAGCHISEDSSFDKLRQRVIRYFDHTKLLLVDECHLFFETYQDKSTLRCLETLREIHDKTQCGLVLCGTDVFRDEMQKGRFSAMLKQLKRRGVYELQLPSVAPREDLDAIAAEYGLKPATGEAEKLMLLIARQDGLGKFIKFLAAANAMAAKKKERVGWEHFVRAHDLIARLSVAEGGGL